MIYLEHLYLMYLFENNKYTKADVLNIPVAILNECDGINIIFLPLIKSVK